MPEEGVTRKGLDLASVLELSCLRGARVVAGARGLQRKVSRLNVMEVPDITAWVKPDELLLTTGYALRQEPGMWAQLVVDLADAELAGVAVKLGRYVHDLPPEMLEEADRRDFPVIELPADLAFDEVISQVLEAVLESQASLLSMGEDAHRALVEIVLAGGDLDLLCEGLVRILGGAVCISAMAGEVVSEAGDRELLARARQLPCFDEEGRFHAARVRTRSTEGRDDAQCRDAESEDRQVHIAVERIAAGAEGHGHLVLVGRDAPLAKHELHVLERAATVAALAITKSAAVAAVEAKYRADFLRDVLTGRAGSAQRMSSYSHSLGWDLNRPAVVVVAELDIVAENALSATDLRDLDTKLTQAWTRAVYAAHKSAPAAGFRDEVAALIPVHRDWEPGKVSEYVNKFVATVRNDRTASLPTTFSVGISRVVDRLEDLPRSYESARRALTLGRKVHGCGGVMAFDDLGVFRLLSLIEDSGELTSFVDDVLGALIAIPAPDNTSLLQTLTVFLETGMNIAETARILHFHYNTLRYRITRIESILGPFTSDPQLRLRILVALQVREMRGIPAPS